MQENNQDKFPKRFVALKVAVGSKDSPFKVRNRVPYEQDLHVLAVLMDVY